MTAYIAIIHKDPDCCFGVQFPDLPGVFTAADTFEETVANARDVIAFAADDWSETHGRPFPAPRSYEQLADDPEFLEASKDGLLALIPFSPAAPRVAAE